MSQRWLKFLNKFGPQGRVFSEALDEEELEQRITNPRMFGSYDVLFHLYGPMPGSPWIPFHCPTLFASIDKLRIAPKLIELSTSYHQTPPPTAWKWLGPDTMVVVDVPGATAIEVGAILMKNGAQPICTFDHWAFSTTQRSARTAIESRTIINTMFTLAPDVLEMRKKLSVDSAPMWLCDSRRLGGRGRPTPGTFDNRYYIDDSILAGINTLKKAGIRRVVYVSRMVQDTVLPDLVPLFIEAHKEGMSIERVGAIEQNTWTKPAIMDVPFKTSLPILGFRRTDMGGFGQMVPVPSEGSYSSGGGGG